MEEKYQEHPSIYIFLIGPYLKTKCSNRTLNFCLNNGLDKRYQHSMYSQMAGLSVESIWHNQRSGSSNSHKTSMFLNSFSPTVSQLRSTHHFIGDRSVNKCMAAKKLNRNLSTKRTQLDIIY